MVFSVCSLWGFSKSAAIKKRAQKLQSFSRSASDLAEQIRFSSGEIMPLLTRTFKDGLLDFGEDGFSINEAYYKREDLEILHEFMGSLGLCDSEAEYRRISGYAQIIRQRGEDAFKECEALCRLYKSLGCLGGIFICIFLL